MALLDKASQLGLRTLALAEEIGGAGADHLTCCIVTEELAAGDAGIAATLAETSSLRATILRPAETRTQRDRLLPRVPRRTTLSARIRGPRDGYPPRHRAITAGRSARERISGGQSRRRLDHQRHQGLRRQRAHRQAHRR